MLEEAQAFICKSVEDVDGGAKFRLDEWTRENGDVGVTAVMAGGKVVPRSRARGQRRPPDPGARRPRRAGVGEGRLQPRRGARVHALRVVPARRRSPQAPGHRPRLRIQARYARAHVRVRAFAHERKRRTRWVARVRGKGKPGGSAAQSTRTRGRRQGALHGHRAELGDAPAQPALPDDALQLPLLRDRRAPPPRPPPLSPHPFSPIAGLAHLPSRDGFRRRRPARGCGSRWRWRRRRRRGGGGFCVCGALVEAREGDGGLGKGGAYGRG